MGATILRAVMLTAAALIVSIGAAFAQAGDNIKIVQDYYAAVNAGDVATAMTFIADDVVFINPNGRYDGAAAVEASLEGLAAEKLTFELSNFKDAEGRVTYDYVVKVNGEAVETGTTGLTWVKDGKIVFDGTTDTEAQWKM